MKNLIGKMTIHNYSDYETDAIEIPKKFLRKTK